MASVFHRLYNTYGPIMFSCELILKVCSFEREPIAHTSESPFLIKVLQAL